MRLTRNIDDSLQVFRKPNVLRLHLSLLLDFWDYQIYPYRIYFYGYIGILSVKWRERIFIQRVGKTVLCHCTAIGELDHQKLYPGTRACGMYRKKSSSFCSRVSQSRIVFLLHSSTSQMIITYDRFSRHS